MKGKRSPVPIRGLIAVLAVLLAILWGATTIVNGNASTINSLLGTSNTKLVNESGEEVDANYFKSEFETLADAVQAQNELAEQLAAEGSVLFKNNNSALPIDIEQETVTLWGLNSHNPTLGGQIGSTAIVADGSTQVYYDIETAFAEKGFTLNQDMIDLYSSDSVNGTYGRAGGHGVSPSFGVMYANFSSYNLGEAPASIYTDAVLSSADDTVAVVVISRDSSEANDYYPDMENSTEGDDFERPLALSTNEQAMIELAKAHSTRVIVLLNCDNPVEIDALKNDNEIDAILWVGAPGVNGFLGVADVLSGAENPSGHIADTYAVNSTSSPAMVNFGVYLYTNYSGGSSPALSSDNKGDWYVVESEGIYTGYKYYETRYEDQVLGQGNATATEGSSTGSAWSYADEVSYPFGYGLSYTTFEQVLESVELEIGGNGTATVTVTNTGNVAGKSVAQLYVQSPYTSGGIEKSAVQLVSYAKTDLLEPGDSQTLTIEFDPSYFASYDETATKANGTVGAWVLEAGDYYFAIGNGAHEALNNILANKTGSESGLIKTADTDVINAENVVVWTNASTDIETYSENVENQLQDADINNLIAGTVEYTTRNDWTRGWESIDTLTATEAMLANLKNQIYTFTENGDGVTWGADNGLTIFDMMVLDDEGNYEGVLDLDDPLWDDLLDQITLDEAIQFIEKGGDDVEDISSIKLARSYANDGPVGFAYDQVAGYYVRWTSDLSAEEGYVSKSAEDAEYSMAVMPTEPVVAATFNNELVERQGELFGESALWSNESSLFAPGTNLHRTPYCARNHEYYSEDSMLTSLMATAVCTGGESKGLMMEAKHFAFNHQEANRSGVSTFFNEQAGRENELRCFQYIMSENLTAGVMSSFNRIGTVYAGAYSNLLINIARNEWGYEGWFNTDMINGADYMNWRDVTAAGGGNCLTSSAYDGSTIGTMAASKSVIEKDTYFQEQMKTSLKYWLYQLADSNAMNGQTANTEIVYVLAWYQKALYGVMIGLGVIIAALAVVGVVGFVKRPNDGTVRIVPGAAYYLTMLGLALTVVCIFEFGSVMYRYTGVYYFLGAGIVVSVLALFSPLVAKNKWVAAVAGLIPIINAVLLASAFIWGTTLMVNQIAYWYTGLDQIDTIMSWIIFAVITLAGTLISVVACFFKMTADVPEGEEGKAAVSKSKGLVIGFAVAAVAIAVGGGLYFGLSASSDSGSGGDSGVASIANATEADLPTAAVFEPNQSYDVYTVLEYTIEAIEADIVATISANNALSEFEILCQFYGEDQYCTVSYDGSEYTVTEDASGFMTGDAPAIIEAAIEQNIWVATGGGSASSNASGDSIANATAADLPAEPVFEPNQSYDVYTVLEYTIEAIDADITATISANNALSEFEILCEFYGEDQYCTVTYDGSEYTVTEDASGFMTGDAPSILEAAIQQDIWVATDSGASGDSIANATAADLPAEPAFEPNQSYDVYTVLEYTIEAIGADITATISADNNLSSFEILCNFYGEDQYCTVTYDGSEYTVTEDASGFMTGDAPAIIEAAIEQNIWVATGGGASGASAANATEADLAAAPEFEPSSGYAVYTTVEYNIAGSDTVCTVSANDELNEFEILCNFYGDDQQCTATYDGSEFTITYDKTSFMTGDAPGVLTAALEQNIWVAI